MSPKSLHNDLPAKVLTGILGFILMAVSQACNAGVENPHPDVASPSPTSLPISTSTATESPTIQPTLPPVKTATQTSTPYLTETSIPELTPSLFPRSLEAFALRYDENATIELPPPGSVSMIFWGQRIPVKPIESTPEFIPYPTPVAPYDSSELLSQAKCKLDGYFDITCSPDSPLMRFDCEWITNPGSIGYGLEPRIPLLGICEKGTEEREASKAGGVYLIGCAFKAEVHFIFKTEDDYLLVSSKAEINDLFLPINSPDEAVSYAQMVTGLDAVYNFSFDPTLMYFDESIESTHVTQNGSQFDMNLFHMQGCGCEPWFTTQINIRVDRAGLITWKDAVPVYMTTGWSCAD